MTHISVGSSDLTDLLLLRGRARTFLCSARPAPPARGRSKLAEIFARSRLEFVAPLAPRSTASSDSRSPGCISRPCRVNIFGQRQRADRGLDRVRSSFAALYDPAQYPEVLAEARATGSARPSSRRNSVHVIDRRQVVEFLRKAEPVLPVVRRSYSRRKASSPSDRGARRRPRRSPRRSSPTRRSRRSARRDSSLSPRRPAARARGVCRRENDRGDRDAGRVLGQRRVFRIVGRGNGESRVGMGGRGRCPALYGLPLPVDRRLADVLVFPPRLVFRGHRDVCVDRVVLDHVERGAVRVLVRARNHAEIAGFRD